MYSRKSNIELIENADDKNDASFYTGHAYMRYWIILALAGGTV